MLTAREGLLAAERHTEPQRGKSDLRPAAHYATTPRLRSSAWVPYVGRFLPPKLGSPGAALNSLQMVFGRP